MTARTILTMANGIPADPLCYLATPYTKYNAGLHAAFVDAAKIAAALLASGIKIYSPIVHAHPLAMLGKLDAKDHSIWLPFNEKMLGLADVLIVAHLEGWQESVGTAHEIDTFVRTNRPIFDLNPRTLLMEKRRGPLTREALQQGAA